MSKVLFVISPTLNSFVDPRKGTTGNRIDCASKHFANAMRSNVEIGLVTGATALIGRAALGSGATMATGFLPKMVQLVKAAPKPVKIVAGALVGLSLLVRNCKKGMIEQKYIDRAQFVDNTYREARAKLDGNAAAAAAVAASKKA